MSAGSIGAGVVGIGIGFSIVLASLLILPFFVCSCFNLIFLVLEVLVLLLL